MADTDVLVKQAEEQAVAISKDVSILTKMEAELVITDNESFGKGGDILKAAKAKEAWLVEDRKKITKHFDEAKSIVMAKYEPQILEVKALKDRITKKMGVFEREESERLEAEERRRREEEARQLAAQKKDVLEAAAEAENKEDGENLLNTAAEIEQKQEEVKAAPVAKVIVKTAGSFSRTQYRDNWKAKIVDALKVPRQYCVPDKKALNKLAKETEGRVAIAGVEFWNDKIAVSR